MKVLRLISVAVVAMVMGVASLVAQTQTPPAATDGFVPMSEAGPRELLPATPLVFYAYAFVWLALIAYVFVTWRRVQRVEQDLAAVKQRVMDGKGGR